MLYARAFGWTPEQVENIPVSKEHWLLPIDQAIEADISARRERATREAKHKAKHARP